MSTQIIRPYIPNPFRYSIFQHYHNLAHPGIKTTVKMISSRFVWISLKKDVQNWAKTCIACQINKISRHIQTPVGHFPSNDERFKIVHLDLIGPMPPSEEYIYCLTCIDRVTNWTEVVPLRDIQAEAVAQAFFNCWITRFGTP